MILHGIAGYCLDFHGIAWYRCFLQILRWIVASVNGIDMPLLAVDGLKDNVIGFSI